MKQADIQAQIAKQQKKLGLVFCNTFIRCMLVQDRSKRKIKWSTWRDGDGPPVLWNRMANVSGTDGLRQPRRAAPGPSTGGNCHGTPCWLYWLQRRPIWSRPIRSPPRILAKTAANSSQKWKANTEANRPNNKAVRDRMRSQMFTICKRWQGVQQFQSHHVSPAINKLSVATDRCPVKSAWSSKYFCIFFCNLVQRASKLVLNLSAANFNMFSLAARPSGSSTKTFPEGFQSKYECLDALARKDGFDPVGGRFWSSDNRSISPSLQPHALENGRLLGRSFVALKALSDLLLDLLRSLAKFLDLASRAGLMFLDVLLLAWILLIFPPEDVSWRKKLTKHVFPACRKTRKTWYAKEGLLLGGWFAGVTYYFETKRFYWETK